MIKKISVLVAVILLILSVVGCVSGSTSTTTTTQPAAIKQVRQAQLGGALLVKHLEINMESNMSVMLTLSPGDKVEGFYYMEKGNGLKFQISGESLIYESQLPDDDADVITSDRFSFTASSAQGKAYTLKLSVDDDSKTATKAVTTVFMELIYPVTAEVWFPEGTK